MQWKVWTCSTINPWYFINSCILVHINESILNETLFDRSFDTKSVQFDEGQLTVGWVQHWWSECAQPPKGIFRDTLKMLEILLVSANTMSSCNWAETNRKAWSVRGAFKSIFWKNLGIWPNQVNPPPKLGPQKLKKKNDVYFAF